MSERGNDEGTRRPVIPQKMRDSLPAPAGSQAGIRGLEADLGAISRRFRLRDGVELAARTLWVPLALGAAVLLLSRLVPIPHYRIWALIPLALWLPAVPTYMLLRRQRLLDVARRADRELGLRERLSTALELAADGEQFDPDLTARQRADAVAAAGRVDPARDLPVRWQCRPLILAGTALAIAVVLGLVANPMDDVLRTRAEIAQAAQEEAERLERVAREIEEGDKLDEADKQALLEELREAAARLRANRGDEDKALADLAELQARLRERLDPQAAARSSALESLAAQLAQLSDAQDKEPSVEEAAELLEQLAQDSADQTEQERENAAQALEQAASRLGQADAALAQALRNAAAAMRRGDARGAAQAAAEAGEAMAEAQDDLEMQDAVAEALGEAQEGGRRVARTGQLARARTAQQGGRSGQSDQSGQSGQGGQSGQSGQSGQGNQAGPGGQSGQGNQVGSGGGTTANTLPPGTRSGRAGDPNRPNKAYDVDATIYAPGAAVEASGEGDPDFIPGQQNEGGQTQTREGQSPMPGALGPGIVPYQDVYQSYAAQAAEAMDKEYVPLNLRDYVRDYFTELEP